MKSLEKSVIGDKVGQVILEGGITSTVSGYLNGDENKLVLKQGADLKIKFQGPMSAQLLFLLAEQAVLIATDLQDQERSKGPLAKLLETEEGQAALAEFRSLGNEGDPPAEMHTLQ